MNQTMINYIVMQISILGDMKYEYPDRAEEIQNQIDKFKHTLKNGI